MAAGLRSSNIHVADQASAPRSAASPRKARSLALALVLGLFLGVGVAFLADALDSSLKSADDVTETLGLPSLGVVPRLEVVGASGRWAIPGSAKATPRSPILAFGNEELKGRGRVREAYRSLPTSILLSPSRTPP